MEGREEGRVRQYLPTATFASRVTVVMHETSTVVSKRLTQVPMCTTPIYVTRSHCHDVQLIIEYIRIGVNLLISVRITKEPQRITGAHRNHSESQRNHKGRVRLAVLELKLRVCRNCWN